MYNEKRKSFDKWRQSLWPDKWWVPRLNPSSVWDRTDELDLIELKAGGIRGPVNRARKQLKQTTEALATHRKGQPMQRGGGGGGRSRRFAKGSLCPVTMSERAQVSSDSAAECSVHNHLILVPFDLRQGSPSQWRRSVEQNCSSTGLEGKRGSHTFSSESTPPGSQCSR